MLAKAHRHVTTNKAGRIVASHLLQPKSVTDTECGINLLASIYGYQKGEVFRKTLSEPMPFNNPEAIRDIDTLLAKPRKRLLAAHPEYAPPPAH